MLDVVCESTGGKMITKKRHRINSALGKEEKKTTETINQIKVMLLKFNFVVDLHNIFVPVSNNSGLPQFEHGAKMHLITFPNEVILNIITSSAFCHLNHQIHLQTHAGASCKYAHP